MPYRDLAHGRRFRWSMSADQITTLREGPMKSKRRLDSPLFVVLSLRAAGTATAQSFNVDFGDTFGTPADSFGAAVGQTGRWNSINGLEVGPVKLLDVNGNTTGVVLVFSLPFGQAQFDHPA